MSDTQAADVETPADATAEPVTGEATSEATSDTPEQLTEVPEPTLSVEASQNDEVAETASPAETPGATADSDEPDVEDQGNKADKGDKKSRVRMLEREGEVAADFLETLLAIADLDEGRVPRRLVGTDGKVLEALQELTRLAVQVETGERSRLMLDIAGHRAQRRSALVELAKVAIEDVKATGTKRALEPMTAFERKVVHDEVAAAGLVSESEGVDPHRHIVILPA